MRYSFDICGSKDIDIIKKQLDSEVVIASGIVERCEHGYPRIILLNSKNWIEESDGCNYEAISNVIWLTCPYLNKRIHYLESSGMISEIKDFITDSRDLTSKMETAHADFYFLRKSIYFDNFKLSVPGRRIELFDSGIGGMSDIIAIKCLHIHFAHFRICEHNIAGDITYRMLDEKINCEKVQCRNAV